MVLSVPFFDADGNLQGAVSAIVRSNEMSGLLPSDEYALVNTRSGYMTDLEGTAQQVQQAAAYIKSARPDPRLDFSAVMPVTIDNNDSEWSAIARPFRMMPS